MASARRQQIAKQQIKQQTCTLGAHQLHLQYKRPAAAAGATAQPWMQLQEGVDQQIKLSSKQLRVGRSGMPLFGGSLCVSVHMVHVSSSATQ